MATEPKLNGAEAAASATSDESLAFAALAGRCDELDGLADPALAPAVEQPLPPDLVAEIKMAIGVAKPVLELLLPYLKGAEQGAWDALVEPIAKLCRHYNVTLGTAISNPWGQLAISAIPLAVHAYSNYQKEDTEKKVKNEFKELTAGDNRSPAPGQSLTPQTSTDAQSLVLVRG